MGVGAIDNPDCFEQFFDQYGISEPPKKFYGRRFDGLSSENVHFWCYNGFQLISNLTYYNLY